MNLFNVYPLFDVTPVRALGSFVWDQKENRYLDFYGGHAVISIGHSHPYYVQSIEDQLHKIAFYSNSIKNPLQKELAVKLGRIAGLQDYQMFLCNSGAEANENALKLASFVNGRKEFISFNKGFHGRTSAAVNVTDNAKIQAPINEGLVVHKYNFEDVNAVCQEIAKNNICALILEPIQGIGGMISIETSSLETIADQCKKHGTLLIMDEVQCGYGRSGKFFAYQYADIKPDLITCAKGMANGFPIGATLIHPDIKASYGLLGTTFGGNHLACAAAIAVLDIIENENLIAHTLKMESLIRVKMKNLSAVKKVRGSGLMLGLEFDFPIKELRKSLIFDHHIFTGSSSDPNVLRLLPPLNIGEEEVNLFVMGLQNALK